MGVKHLSEKEKEEVIRLVQKSLGGLQGIINKGLSDDGAEFSFTDIAHILRLDRKKPWLIADKLPPPFTTPLEKTCEYVWKWKDLKTALVREVYRNAIIDLADL